MRRTVVPCFLALILCGVEGEIVGADEQIADRIDAIIAAQAGTEVAPQTDDFAYCRRVYLDLAGRIPSMAELVAFVNDSAQDKRGQLVERLLTSPEFVTHMRDVWNVQWMERMGDHPEWLAFLEHSFRENRPWQEVTRQILHPDEESELLRGAAYFYTRRLDKYGQNPVDLPGLTRDVGRLFLGVDLQCAQCHDHLFIDDYLQLDFQGLHAFVSHLTIRQDVSFPAVAEQLVDKKTDFMSVFLKEPRQTGPRLPFGEETEIVVFAKGEEFVVPPDRKTRFPGQPKYSPLEHLASSLPTLENPRFVRNAVNRWWWLLMGRGLVHPLDLTHAGNPPSHPEVLDLLAAEFVAHQGDIRWLIKTLTATETYQRSSRLPQAESTRMPHPDRFAVALEKPLSAEQLASSVWQATGQADVPTKEIRQRFVTAFASPPREPELDFAPSVKAALFLSHDEQVLSLTQTAPEKLSLSTAADFSAQLDIVWKTVLSRPATPEEIAAAESLRSRSGNDTQATSQIIWALINSTEFCLNH